MNLRRAPSLALLLALAACKPDAATPDGADAGAVAAPSSLAGPVQSPLSTELKDEIETAPTHVIGISYPPAINQYPGLAQVVGDYARGARNSLMQSLQALGDEKPRAPYELSLSFEQVLSTPELIGIAADGSLYTGGAHAAPLVARIVWLPKSDTQLTAAALVPSPAGWQAISAHVREQLLTRASLRADADALSPEERESLLQSASRFIDEGAGAEVGNFQQFLPVLGADGRIAALRFVFPPYQVGPYSDGTQEVEVPASVLKPYLAPEYAALFVP